MIDHLRFGPHDIGGAGVRHVLRAGGDDRARFDKLLAWTRANLAHGDLTQHLPAWSWGKAPDGQLACTRPNPASDADLWMTYDLLEAGRLWGSADSYTKIGTAMAERIAADGGAATAAELRGRTAAVAGAGGFHDRRLHAGC